MPHYRKGSSRVYIYVTLDDGRRVSRSAGTRKWNDAAAWEGKLEQERWERKRMGVKPQKTWREAVVRWVADKAHKVSLKDDRQRLRWLDPHLDGLRLNEITRERVDEIMLTRSGVSTSNATSENRTANHYVALIAWILTAAEREWEWGNRCPRFRTYPVLEYQKRALTVEEWFRLCKELPPHLRRIATFSLSTGLREAKVFGLRWQNANLEKRSLALSGTKNKLGVCVPLNSTAMAVLQECRSLPVVHADRVFVYDRTGRPMNQHQHESWEGAFERSGVTYCRYHDLRTTFITWLYQAQVPEWAVRSLAGHTTKSVHQGYNRADIESLRPYSEVIDRVLDAQNLHTLPGSKQHSKS
jgi:integrase